MGLQKSRGKRHCVEEGTSLLCSRCREFQQTRRLSCVATCFTGSSYREARRKEIWVKGLYGEKDKNGEYRSTLRFEIWTFVWESKLWLVRGERAKEKSHFTARREIYLRRFRIILSLVDLTLLPICTLQKLES